MPRPARPACAAMLATLLATCALVGPAHGAPAAGKTIKPSDDARARALYKQSKSAYDEGRFQDAAALLEEAYALEPVPVFLFNLARAYEGVGAFEKAIDAYERYLAGEPGASDRKSVEARVVALKKTLADRAALEKQRDDETKRAEQAALQAREEQRARAEEAARNVRTPSPVPWIVAGVGVVGVGTGVVFGLVSRARYHAAVDEPYAAPADAKYASAKSWATAANVALVTGGALTLGGVVWGLLDRRAAHETEKAPRATAWVSIGAGTVTLEGRF